MSLPNLFELKAQHTEKAHHALTGPLKPLKISPPKNKFMQKKKSPRVVYRVQINSTKAIELNPKPIKDSPGRKEKAINLIVELVNISPLADEMDVEHISSPGSPFDDTNKNLPNSV